MKTRTDVKAGGLNQNHNEALVRETRKTKGIKVKTSVKAGGVWGNHNETLVTQTLLKFHVDFE